MIWIECYAMDKLELINTTFQTKKTAFTVVILLIKVYFLKSFVRIRQHTTQTQTQTQHMTMACHF